MCNGDKIYISYDIVSYSITPHHHPVAPRHPIKRFTRTQTGHFSAYFSFASLLTYSRLWVLEMKFHIFWKGPRLIPIILNEGVESKVQSGMSCLRLRFAPVVFCGVNHTEQPQHTLSQQDIKLNPLSYIKYLLGIQNTYGAKCFAQILWQVHSGEAGAQTQRMRKSISGMSKLTV